MEIILAAIVSFVVTAVVGKLLIPALVRLKAGQSIKEIGPKWHMSKQGTPTMGGLMFIIGIGVAIVICGWNGMLAGNFQHLYVYLFALVFGGIGYIDDYQKVKHHQNTGLTSPQKFLLQLAAAVAALAFAYDMPLILILVGFVYICETLSDIIQVAYFKLTHGKRIFKMAPLHHHFEMCGWSEKKVVAVFTAVSLLFCLLAVVAVSGRFLAA